MDVAINSEVGGGLKIAWGAEHRDGHCPDCGSLLEEPTKEDKAEYHVTRLLKRKCPKCKERKAGKLIVRQFSIQPPVLKCIRIRCLMRYARLAIYYGLFCLHEQYRTIYAEEHRHDDIPEHFRTGRDAPASITGLLLAILRFKTRR